MDKELTPTQATLVLNGLSGVGPVTLRRLFDHFGEDPRSVLAAGVSALRQVQGVGPEMASTIANWRSHFDLAKEEEKLARGGVNFIHTGSVEYPPLLKEIYDPPIGLYTKGPLRVGRKTVAIVGSRHTTLYGQGVARRLAADLARLGICVASGLARGIDTAAHEGALEAGGPTVAVLGCGLDIIYPPENIDLYRRLEKSGAIFSEFRLGTRATKSTFPMRNRLLSGMSLAVIVVESDASGGSMITARFAAEQNRQVFAVPGRIDQPSSRGCHQLIRDGATLLTCVDDLLEELQFAGEQLQMPGLDATDEAGVDGASARGFSGSGQATEAQAGGLSGDEARVYRYLCESGLRGADDIAGALGLPMPVVAATLMMLELKKRVVKRADGTFEARG
ncbi:DNA-protecting protein DprA [Ruficoccus amylovorans]|uniref:DNA-protecting protein DprA n=1 Tax=Ruficoccus amylovorans TaxID=1804625 RepID=A0A842HAM7_9BACT|nr:DNA-processing protein DprA [Ruficoccus amylovorans]MBC2593138.1 DNA-protecting protein DprA [Ruficoccus amylovorans]